MVLIVGGAIGIAGGLWPLLTGRNFPGVLGRGFTNSDNLRLKRAPAIYFRALGATVASAGLFVLYVGVLIELAPDAAPPGLIFATTAGGVALFLASFGWLVLLAHRHKLFRWNTP